MPKSFFLGFMLVLVILVLKVILFFYTKIIPWQLHCKNDRHLNGNIFLKTLQ